MVEAKAKAKLAKRAHHFFPSPPPSTTPSEVAMPSMYVVGKSVLSLMAFPGCMMAAVGAGALPVDAEMAQFPPFW